MTEISAETMMDGWVRECGKGAAFPPPEFHAINRLHMNVDHMWREARRENGDRDYWSTPWIPENPTPEQQASFDRQKREWEQENSEFILRVTETGAFTVQQVGGRTRPTVELARHIGKRDAKRSVVLLNGDGFDHPRLQRIQAELRGGVQRVFTGIPQRLIVPYAALESARLDLDSIVPVHIAADRNVTRVVEVPKPPDKLLDKHRRSKEVSISIGFEYKDRSYRTTWQGWPPPGRSIFHIMHLPEFARGSTWHEIFITADGTWTVHESVHRLGAAVFTAIGPDGKRHRWISSFDQNEQPAMYFLAQLPDAGGVRYITHAERLLAPKIVHKARKDGRQVFRQGDIFAVETDMKDEDFSLDQIVLRPQVFEYLQLAFPQTLTSGTNIINQSGGTIDTTQSFTIVFTLSAPAAPVVENTWMTSTTSGIADGQWVLRADVTSKEGLKLRRGLMIYRTGHTASMVAVTSYGTFVKGIMYHDPVLENIRAGRRPEHRALPLGDGTKWFLAVRNTVPRQQQTTTDTGGTTNANDTVPNMPDTQPRKRRVSEPELSGRSGRRNRGRVPANV